MEKLNLQRGHCAGGIVGYIVQGEVKQCYNKETIYAEKTGAGGIVGVFKNTIEITDCYNVEKIKSNDTKYQGAIIGRATGNEENSGATINNSYYLENTADTSIGANISSSKDNTIAKTEADMKTQEFVDILGNAIWKMNPNYGYPILYWQ